MGQGCADKPNTFFDDRGNARTHRAKDRPARTDATACARSPLTTGGESSPSVEFRSPEYHGAMRLPRVGTTPRGSRFLFRTAIRFAVGAITRSAPSHSAARVIRDRGDRADRSAAVLSLFYVMLVAWLLLTGCDAPNPKTARPGLDAATGTAQSLKGELDTIEYHADELKKELR